MKTILLFLSLLVFQHSSYCCSWSHIPFCKTSQTFDTLHANVTIVSGVVTNSDSDGVDLEVIEVLAGLESKTTIRIWDGTDFDCNGLHSMAAGDFLRLGDSIVIILPMIDQIENTWDQIGDYRMPKPWGWNPYLKIRNGLVQGSIIGTWDDDHRVTELPYPYFAKEYLGNGICELGHPNLVVSFYHDEDQNGYRSFEETLLPIGAISIPDLGQFENFKHSGIFIFAPEGPMTISYDASFISDWTTNAESIFEIDFLPGRTKYVNIGLIPTRDFSDIAYNIAHSNFRCGEEIPFALIVTNEGTVPTSGSFWLEMDTRLETYVFDEEPDYIDEVAGTFGWDYEDLGAYESIRIPLTITAPLIDDADQLSEIYVLKITGDLNDPRNGVLYHEVELRCSFDPNDKQAFPIREDKLALSSVPLRYTIRFQNTGNDFARNVIVTDTLDEGLDLSTFKLSSTSHPRQLTILSGEGYEKTFEFTNIFLPDSLSDEPNSHGYISFTISPNENISPDTKIDNQASIYFDFNPAIVTKTVSRIIVDKFPLSNSTDIQTREVLFHPNPARDVLTFNQDIEEVLLYDLSGQLIKSATDISQVSISDLDEGIYMMLL